MPTPRFPTATAVLRAARSQVGVTEDPPGSNHTRYGDEYGQPRTYWCGHFVWWCFHQAGIDLRRIGIPHPSFTPSFFAEAAKAGWVRPADAAIEAGDVLFFDFVPPFELRGIQHVGIATGRPHGGRVPTIEGNTSSGVAGSQDNGGGVFERSRGLDVIVAVVRPPYATGPAGKTRTSSKAGVVRAAAAAAAVAGAGVAVGNAVVSGPPARPAVKVSPAPTATAAVRPVLRPPAAPRPTPRPTARKRATAPRGAVQGVIVGPLRYGATGEQVKALQRHLHVTPTGYFGRVTLRKVRAAQRAADIADDGVVGPVTARALGFGYAPANRP